MTKTPQTNLFQKVHLKLLLTLWQSMSHSEVTSVFRWADLVWLVRLGFSTWTQAKALFKWVSGIIQMPHWLLLTITVCSVTPAHAQSEREGEGERERERERESERDREREGGGREREGGREGMRVLRHTWQHVFHLFTLIRGCWPTVFTLLLQTFKRQTQSEARMLR